MLHFFHCFTTIMTVSEWQEIACKPIPSLKTHFSIITYIAFSEYFQTSVLAQIPLKPSKKEKANGFQSDWPKAILLLQRYRYFMMKWSTKHNFVILETLLRLVYLFSSSKLTKTQTKLQSRRDRNLNQVCI